MLVKGFSRRARTGTDQVCRRTAPFFLAPEGACQGPAAKVPLGGGRERGPAAPWTYHVGHCPLDLEGPDWTGPDRTGPKRSEAERSGAERSGARRCGPDRRGADEAERSVSVGPSNDHHQRLTRHWVLGERFSAPEAIF